MEDEPADAFRTGGALSELAQLGRQQRDALIGKTLGDYRIVGLLGQGGMSTVYQAERIDGSFERQVAIKISYLGAMDERARERFLSEQQILAGLNHPHISQLFDAGLTAEGWPYIVMELIDGTDIVDYCDANHLSLQARIDLLNKVVNAVAYAHARLVLHRDIKPSNIIVDDDGIPKLLDFGIAKSLEASTVAQTQGAPMTPRYASPEQFLGKSTGVASDVYQLGLLAFEVLTGERLDTGEDPLELRKSFTAGTSARLPAAVRHKLPGECVAIIEQCLRFVPEERYRDAAALGDDLSAYLDGRPVTAVGQSLPYRTRKYIARNAAAVSLVSIALTALLASTAWYVTAITSERNRAQAQQALAEQSLEFMASFFEAADPVTTAGQELTASQILHQGAARVEKELADQPQIQHRLYGEIAESFYHQESLDEAETYIRKALALDDQLKTDKDDLLSDYYFHLNLLGSILSDKGDYQGAWKINREVFDKTQNALGPMHDRTIKAQNNLAITAKRLGNLDDSRALLEDVYRKRLQLEGPQGRGTLISALNLIGTISQLGDLQGAHELALRSANDAEEALGPEHPVTLYLLGNLSQTTLNVEGPEAAIAVKRKLLARAANVYGNDSFFYLGHLSHLGAMLGRTGALQEAEEAQLEAITRMTALRGDQAPEVLIARSNVIYTWIDMGKFDEAQAELDALMPIFKSRAGPEDGNVVYSRTMQLKIYIKTNDPRADDYASDLYADLVDMFGPEDERALEVKAMLDQANPQPQATSL